MSATTRTAQQPHKRGGGPSCTVCNHARRDELDRALTSGSLTQSDVAREVGCHPSIVSRHRKNHILPKVKRQIEADPVLGEVDLIVELRTLFCRMKHHLDRAEDADNWQAIRAFHAEARQDLETLARIAGTIHDGNVTQVAVNVGADWPRIRTALVRALAPYPDARTAVLASLESLEGA